MERDALLVKIALLRADVCRIVASEEVYDPVVVDASRNLDKLLNEYEKIMSEALKQKGG